MIANDGDGDGDDDEDEAKQNTIYALEVHCTLISWLIKSAILFFSFNFLPVDGSFANRYDPVHQKFTQAIAKMKDTNKQQ